MSSPAIAPLLTPAELQKFEGPLIAMAQQANGSLPKLLTAFFSFLHRRTDFYCILPQDNGSAAAAGGGRSNVGFKEGQAEQILLATFRQFPLRRVGPALPTATTRSSSKSPSSSQEVVGNGTSKATNEGTVSPAKAKKDEIESNKAKKKVVAAASAADVITKDNPETKDKEKATKPTTTTTTTNNNNTKETTIRYTNDGKQIPIGNGGSTSRYVWTQTLEEVTVHIPIPNGTRAKEVDGKQMVDPVTRHCHPWINSLGQMRDSTLQSGPSEEDAGAADALLSLCRNGKFQCTSSDPNPAQKNNVNGQTKLSNVSNLVSDDPYPAKKKNSKGQTKIQEEEKIIAQWFKCVNDMTTAKRIRFLGEYVLHKCVYTWHNKSFDLDSFFVCGITDSSLIWMGMLSDLMSFITKHGRRYASSILRRSKIPSKSPVHSQPISKLASEWAIGVVKALIMSEEDLPCHRVSFVRFYAKHNQMKYIDDNMQTMQRISNTYTRIAGDTKRHSTKMPKVVFKLRSGS